LKKDENGAIIYDDDSLANKPV